MGVGYDDFPTFQAWMTGWSHCRNVNQNFPVGYMTMVGHGLHEALERGEMLSACTVSFNRVNLKQIIDAFILADVKPLLDQWKVSK